MPDYSYIAKESNGRLVRGVITSTDRNKFFTEIKSRSLYLISYEEDIKRGSMILGQQRQLPLKDISIFCRQMASLLKVGISLVKAIDIIYQQTTTKAMKASIKEIYENVQKGHMLSESLQKQTGKYPSIMISLIESGEASGLLAEVVAKIATQFESDLRLQRKVRSSMVYPALLVLIGTAVVILMVTVVLPQFAMMFKQYSIAELPKPTMILLAISSFITGNWYLIIAVLVVLVILIRIYITTDSGSLLWDRFKLKIPVVKNVLISYIVVRFCSTMSSLLSSGIPMLQALTIVTHVVNNKSVARALPEVDDDIRKGLTLSGAIRRISVMPPLVHSMIAVGEESGSLDQMLENAAAYYKDELENKIARLVIMIEPAMIVILAVVIGFIILSVMLPMIEIYKSIA